MSIVGMMRDAALRKATLLQSASPRRRGPGPAEAGAPDDVLATLTRFIPTEAVALYVAILPFLVPEDVPLADQDYASRWGLALGVAVVAVLLSVGVYRRAVLEQGGRFRWPPRRTITVLLAYGAWVFAIPGSPLNDFGWYSPQVGAIVGIATTTLITLFHLWVGKPEQ